VTAVNTVGESPPSTALNATPAVPDTTAPVITVFTAGTTSDLTVPITFTTTGNATGWMIKEVNSAPVAGDTGWAGTAPTSYTTGSYGTKALYGWAKDAAGNVSTVATISSVTFTEAANTYNFIGDNGSAPPTAFTVIKSANATVALDGAGHCAWTLPAVTDYGMLVRTAPITPASAKTYTIRGKTASFTDNNYGELMLATTYSASLPAASAATFIHLVKLAPATGVLKLYLEFINSAGTLYYWNGSAWITGVAALTFTGFDWDAYFSVKLITTDTYWQYEVYNAAGTLMITTAAIQWSSTKSPGASNVYLWSGDASNATYASGPLKLDSWIET
jgi:hypothetical protein